MSATNICTSVGEMKNKKYTVSYVINYCSSAFLLAGSNAPIRTLINDKETHVSIISQTYSKHAIFLGDNC